MQKNKCKSISFVIFLKSLKIKLSLFHLLVEIFLFMNWVCIKHLEVMKLFLFHDFSLLLGGRPTFSLRPMWLCVAWGLPLFSASLLCSCFAVCGQGTRLWPWTSIWNWPFHHRTFSPSSPLCLLLSLCLVTFTSSFRALFQVNFL